MRDAFRTLLGVVGFLAIAEVVGRSVKFQTMDFPAMPAAMKNHSVDAATLTEPFVAKANQAGSIALADAASGPTSDIPIAGFAASSRFTQQNPAAVAKFQQVMARASNESNQDRTKVEEELPKYSKVDPTTAKLVRIGNFPTTLEQRSSSGSPTSCSVSARARATTSRSTSPR